MEKRAEKKTEVEFNLEEGIELEFNNFEIGRKFTTQSKFVNSSFEEENSEYSEVNDDPDNILVSEKKMHRKVRNVTTPN